MIRTPSLILTTFATALSTLLLTRCATVPRLAEKTDESIQKEIVPLIGPSAVTRYIFANGLRLLVAEDHSSPTLAFQTWFKVGSSDEVRGRTGLAHFFEHMMFKETKNLKDGEFHKILESSGVVGKNAFTRHDYTAYIAQIPKDNLELIAKVESDRMVNLVVNPHVFKIEKEVVQNERRFRTENSPDGIMAQELFQLAFDYHPYRWPVYGYQKDLEEMSADDALQFYRAHYGPAQATLVVVGDVNPESTKEIVQRYYGNLSDISRVSHPIPAEPPQQSPRSKDLKLNIQAEKLLIGYRVPGMGHEDNAALEVIKTILAGSKSSRLYRALVESGISSSVEINDFEEKDPTLFTIATNLQKSRKGQKERSTIAERSISKEIKHLIKKGPTADELERVRNRAAFNLFENLGSNLDKAIFLGFYETLAGDFSYGLKLNRRIQLVSSTTVQSVAKKYFSLNNRTVIRGIPK